MIQLDRIPLLAALLAMRMITSEYDSLGLRFVLSRSIMPSGDVSK